MAEDPLTTHARARVGRLLRGKWTLDRLIGVGGMAAVYEATHRNGSKVAIKLLHPTLMFDTGFAQRLVQEGYVANKIAHPAAVKVFDDDTDDVDGAVFLVMELLEGQPLSSLRRQRKRIPPDEALRLMAPVMECLGFAHQKGIVHRDIKPDNLFVSRDGSVRVLDFGIARINDGSNVNATRTGMVVGSPAYMAPEQALGKMNAVGSQTDVYAIGATLFALITGTTPHAGESTQEMIIMVATQAARPLSSVMPDVHPAVARVVDKALAYEREQRYPDAMAMLHDVRAALLEMETGAPPQVLPSFADDEEEGETRVSPAMKKDTPEAKPAPAAGQGRVGARPAPPPSPFGPPIRPNESGSSSQPGASGSAPAQAARLRAATLAPTGAPSANLTPKGLAPAQPALPATQAMEAFPVPSDDAPVSEPPPPPASPMATQAMDISSFNNPMAPLAPLASPEVGVTSGQRPEATTGMAWAGAPDEAPPKPSRAKPLALAAAGLVVLLGVGFALKGALGTDDPAPAQTATPPTTATPARPATPPVVAQPETPPVVAQPETPPVVAQPETPPAQPETPPAQPETPPAQPETPPVVAQPETPPAAARPEPLRGAHERRRATPASDTPAGNTARPRRRRNADPLGY
jgi:serine/threonine protein kinase